MKAYTKVELAAAAGVSTQTFRRWLKTDESYLRAHNVTRTSKMLPPKVVQYLCDKYAIDLPA